MVHPIKIKTKLACVLEASESTRLRMGESLPNHNAEHFAGKGDNSLQHYNLVHKIYSNASSSEDTAAKAAVDKEWEKLEKIPAWNLTKVWNKSEVIGDAGTKGAKVHFASLMDIVIYRMLNWRQSTKNTKVELYSEVILWKMILDLTQYSLNKDLQHLKWQPLKSWISSPDCLVAMDKQQTQYRLFPTWRWKMLTNYWKFQNRSVQTFGFVYHDTNGQNHGPVWKTQSFLLNAICTVILWQDYYGKGIFRKSYWSTYGRSLQLGMSLCSSWKRVILSFVCGWYKIGWKETKHWSDVESTQQRSRFGRTNIFPGSCILGMHSTTMRNKQRYCGQLQNHVWIANFRRESREITIPSKSSYLFMVLWHGWSCKEVCGTILWVSKHNDSTTLQSVYSMHRWPSFQRGRIEVCWRIVTSMLSKCSEMFVLGTYWKTWYSMVSE